MTDRQAVRCPWCGEEMERDEDAFCYDCYGCGAQSPLADSWDAALTAALRRYVEPLKPLELHEATGSVEPCVFMELKGNEAIRACDCVISSDLQCVEVSLIGSARPSWMPINFYGKKWRCWSRRPTDEEREAVGWG